MKRIFLFLATNIAVLVVINIILHITGLNRAHDTGSVLAYAAVVGFTGSIISLLLSKSMAKAAVGAEVITSPRTGATKNSSLVAVSTGLLNNMTRDEVEAVLAHEMAHIGNGDMVTLTLIQGIVNTFVVFFARIIASAVAQGRDGENNQGIYFAVSMVLQVLFGFLASIIVMWFSRQREYRADAGAAKLVGPAKMIAALQRLKGGESRLPQNMTAMGIASESKDSLLSTHPSLDNRIARLQMM